jgi:tRNA modification GTPase
MHTIEHLLRAHEAYVPLKDGIRTVIVGLPNAGKSTLFNKLLGFERAIVSSVPGTTRDFIAETLSLEPYALRLVDTAGLRDTDNDIELLGIEQTREQLQKADLILWVIDGSQPWSDELEALKARVPPEKVLILLNKADCGLHPSVAEQFPKVDDLLRVLKAKEEGSSTIAGNKEADGAVFGKKEIMQQKEAVYLSDSEKKQTSSDSFPSSVLYISLKDEARLPLLRQRLKAFLDERYEDVSNVGFLVHERHAEALKSAYTALQHASTLLEQKNSDDCLAADLKEALHSLEAIVGRVDYEQVLDKVFSKFCIGK